MAAVLRAVTAAAAQWKPKRLVFGGGGARVTVYNYALQQLEATGMLTDVREYWGTSAGALFAALLSLTGASAAKLRTLVWTTDFKQFRNLDVKNLLNIQTTWGVDDGTKLTAEVERLFEAMEPGSSRKTLADLPALHTVVADVTLRETVVLSSKTYPTLRAVDAVRASMALPLYLQPFRCPVDGHIMVDGGLRANFPWDLLPADAVAESMGFAVEKEEIPPPLTFTEYIFTMIHHEAAPRNRVLRGAFPTQILWFKTPPFPAWFSRFQAEDYTLVDAISAEAYEAWLLVRPYESKTVQGDSSHPRETSETPVPCAPLNTLQAVSPAHHTGESSDSPSPATTPSRDASPPQSLHTQPPSRRWSV